MDSMYKEVLSNKEVKLELAKMAISTGSSIEYAKMFYRWVTEEEPLQEKYKNETLERLCNCLGSRYGEKVREVARDNNFCTIGELLNMGSIKFRGLEQIGAKTAWRVTEALGELYGITKW